MTIGGNMIEFPWQIISTALRASMMAEISEDALVHTEIAPIAAKVGEFLCVLSYYD